MIHIVPEVAADAVAREILLDRAFGPSRHIKTSARLRAGRLPTRDLAFVALSLGGRVVGTVRLWDVVIGEDRAALMLGPLAVDPAHEGQGIGSALMRHALAAARAAGHGAVILVGDAPYYARFGFDAAPMAAITLPGPVERPRFLGLELVPGALAGATGLVRATGPLAPELGDVLPALARAS